jgi:hypothetical protein
LHLSKAMQGTLAKQGIARLLGKQGKSMQLRMARQGKAARKWKAPRQSKTKQVT